MPLYSNLFIHVLNFSDEYDNAVTTLNAFSHDRLFWMSQSKLLKLNNDNIIHSFLNFTGNHKSANELTCILVFGTENIATDTQIFISVKKFIEESERFLS